jgi:hypothetical protein
MKATCGSRRAALRGSVNTWILSCAAVAARSTPTIYIQVVLTPEARTGNCIRCGRNSCPSRDLLEQSGVGFARPAQVRPVFLCSRGAHRLYLTMWLIGLASSVREEADPVLTTQFLGWLLSVRAARVSGHA